MRADLNTYIEHTLLKPSVTKEDIQQLCEEAITHNFYGVCVPPYYVKQVARLFRERKAGQKIITVVGFPMGYSAVSAKVEEIKKAIQEGAHELDVVINQTAFFSKDTATLKNDIESTVMACHLQNRKIKMILETGALTDKEIIKLCDLCVAAGVDFIKTSTGFHEKGATVEAIRLIRSHVPERIGIKASGGIKTSEQALAMLEAGATRIGTSSGIALLKENEI